MLRGWAELLEFRMFAAGGEIGAVRDLLFDDQAWTLRYFVVGADPTLSPQDVLVSPVAVEVAEWESRRLRTALALDRVHGAPPVDVGAEGFRQEEERLIAYYAWPAYWGVPAPGPDADASREQQDEVASQVEQTEEAARGENPHLRSFREFREFDILTPTGATGKLRDVVGDDSGWILRHLVCDARFRSSNQQRLLPREWIMNIDWQQSQIHVKVAEADILRAPLHESAPIDRDAEARLSSHFKRATTRTAQ